MSRTDLPDGPTLQVRDGVRAAAADPAAALADGAQLVWTALSEPSSAELDAAVHALGLPPGLLTQVHADVPAEVVTAEPARRRRPRVLEDGQARGLVLLPATYDDGDEQVTLGVLSVLVAGRAVLTVRRGAAPDLARLRDAPPPGPDALLHAVLVCVLQGYDDVLEDLEDDVTDVETQVFSDNRRSYAQRIYGLKREALELQRAVLPLDDLVLRLGLPPAVHERVLRLREHVERLDTLLDGVLSADLAQVGVRQNEDQRTISAWAAIALVPTIVAGVYGMNFQHMPELSWRFGYPGALALIVTVCLLLHRGFRRHGWLGRPEP